MKIITRVKFYLQDSEEPEVDFDSHSKIEELNSIVKTLDKANATDLSMGDTFEYKDITYKITQIALRLWDYTNYSDPTGDCEIQIHISLNQI